MDLEQSYVLPPVFRPEIIPVVTPVVIIKFHDQVAFIRPVFNAIAPEEKFISLTVNKQTAVSFKNLVPSFTMEFDPKAPPAQVHMDMGSGGMVVPFAFIISVVGIPAIPVPAIPVILPGIPIPLIPSVSRVSGMVFPIPVVPPAIAPVTIGWVSFSRIVVGHGPAGGIPFKA